jgi:methylated-DNA-protein-cysteine methyltransferase-like protein
MSVKYTSPPDRFQYYLQVWELVKQIPPGKVATYGQIASMIPPPEGVNSSTYQSFSPRWVGGAMAACPDDVPWQRVVNAQGKISMRQGEGHMLQRSLLESEGIVFNKGERIDLNRYSWHGNSDVQAAKPWIQTSFDELI